MKLFRHLGLIIAVFWCAAMVVAPMAATAGTGQGTNQGPGTPGMGPGQAGPGNNQMQPGQGISFGNDGDQTGNGQGTMGPGQGPGFGNRSQFNMTAPPDRVPDNTTALNLTERHGHGNMTRFTMSELNRTDIHPPGDLPPVNMTADNQTPPDQPPQQDGGSGQNPQGGMSGQLAPGEQTQQQAKDQNNAGNSLISELVSWLKAHGVT